ncbi:MAG: alpha amylase C-terminal domain-containing protein, partial [Candidatus Saccharimonadales bacterium]
AHTIYKVTLPVKGTWYVRFNSSWKGYSSDFQQTNIDSVTTDEHNLATIRLAPYSVYILSQDQDA